MVRTADNVEMQGIEFQIVNDSDAASHGLEVLAQKLNVLKSATNGSSAALSRVAAGINSIKKALDGVSTSGFVSKLNQITESLGKLKSQTENLKLSASIGKQLSSIDEAIQALPDTPGEKLRNLADGLAPLSGLGTAKLGSFISQLGKLPELIAALDSANIDKFTQQMRNLANAIRPFANEMNKISSGFSALPSRIQKVITSTERYNKVVGNATTGTTAFGRAIKKLSLLSIFKKIGTFLGQAINKATQYIEDMNLFAVSMGQYGEEAYNYATKVSELLGLDPAAWMRNQGVFNTIITGFGVAADKAAFMSKNLTQLGYDLSSFYNISVQDAMQKVQSGIAGELEPLRRLGFDLSVARLEQERLNLGIEKSVSSMTQAEKSQLRYYAIMTQVTQVQGDMARTLEDPANMLRVLQAQLVQAGRAIGDLFLPMLTKVLPVLIAVAKAIREIIASIALLFGAGLKTPDWKNSIGGAVDGSGEISDNLDSAAGSAKELKRYLAGFDELNVLPSQSAGGGGSGASAGGGFDIELPGYNILDGVSESVDKISEKLKPLVEWVKNNLDDILKVAGAIGTVILGWNISNGFSAAIKAIKGLSTAGNLVLGVSLAIAGFSLELDGIKKALQDGLSGINLGEILLGALGGVSGFGFIGTALGNGLLGAAIGGIVAGIPMFVAGVYDAITGGLNTLNAILIPVASALTGAAIGLIVGGPVGAGIGALIGLATGALTDIGILVYEKWEEICDFFKPVAEWFNKNIIVPVSSFFSGLWRDISKMAGELWTTITKIFSPAVTWFGNLFGGVWKTVSDVVHDIIQLQKGTFELCKKIWEPIVSFVDKWVIQPLLRDVKWLLENTWQAVVNRWNGFVAGCEELVQLVNSIGKAVLKIAKFVWEGFKETLSGIVGFFKGLLNGVIELLNKALSWSFGGINSILRSLKNFSVAGISPFSGVREINVPQIPLLANGGFVDAGQLFIAREAGAELVGSIGNKAAVANNDQIVEAVSAGVYRAVSEAMGNSQRGSDRPQVVEAKVNGKTLFEVIVDYVRNETVRTGSNPLLEH